jgi:hypothetical protein
VREREESAAARRLCVFDNAALIARHRDYSRRMDAGSGSARVPPGQLSLIALHAVRAAPLPALPAYSPLIKGIKSSYWTESSFIRSFVAEGSVCSMEPASRLRANDCLEEIRGPGRSFVFHICKELIFDNMFPTRRSLAADEFCRCALRTRKLILRRAFRRGHSAWRREKMPYGGHINSCADEPCRHVRH